MITDANPKLIAEMLRQGLSKRQTPYLSISSNSMAPLLRTGDQVGLEVVAVSQLKVGDIITLEQDAFLLTHRFWGWDGKSQLKTRGDRPLTFDKPSSPEQLIGRVIIRRRAGKELALTHGSGQWLNRHLVWLYQAEAKLLNLPLPPEKLRRLLVRLVHRKIYIWAYLSNASVTGQP